MPADTDPVVVPAGVGQNDPVIIPAPTPSAGGDNGFLAKINAALGSDNYREPLPEVPGETNLVPPEWEKAPEAAVRELAGSMAPHDLPSYLESLFPPAAMAHHAVNMGEGLAQGDVSGVPLIGRIPEIMQADETPAGSKERYLTAMKTLMDLGMLAGGGEGANDPVISEAPPAQPPPIPEQYQGRFTMVPPAPESPPQMAPSVPIEQQLPNIQPPPFNPELGPMMQPDFKMPVQTDFAQSPNAQPLFPTPPPGTPLKGTPLVGPNGSTPAADAAAAQPQVAPQVPQGTGTVRLYHGSSLESPQAGRDFTTDLQYAKDYAAKAQGGGEGKVWYVDVPQGLLKTHDEYGQPMTRVVVPDHIANQAQALGDERYAGVTPQPASPEGNPPGIANRYVEEQIYRGELPPEAMATGTGTTARAAADEARVRLAQDPNLAFQAARRIRNGSVRGGDTAILHAYNDQLAEGAAQARQASFSNPGDPTLKAAADAAEKAHVQFLQDVKPLAGGLAQRIMVGFQGAYPPDLSTYAGMYKEMTQLNEGRPVPPEIRSNLYRRAQKAQKAAQAEKAAGDKLQQAMDKNLPKRPVPTKEQMSATMEEFKRKVAPCP